MPPGRVDQRVVRHRVGDVTRAMVQPRRLGQRKNPGGQREGVRIDGRAQHAGRRERQAAERHAALLHQLDHRPRLINRVRPLAVVDVGATCHHGRRRAPPAAHLQERVVHDRVGHAFRASCVQHAPRRGKPSEQAEATDEGARKMPVQSGRFSWTFALEIDVDGCP